MTAAVVTVRGAPRQRGAIASALLPIVAAIVVGGVVVAWAGASPVEFFRLLAQEAFSGTDRLAASRIFMSGSSECPPASSFASSPFSWSILTASSRDSGAS